MKIAKKVTKIGIAALAAVSLISSALPAFAAKADLDLLQSYVGDWRGKGQAKLASTGENETVLCKMSFTESSQTKIGLDGKCSLAGSTLSMRGTVGYVADLRRFEAVMSSNTSFQGVAVGTRSGKNLSFSLDNVKSETDDAFDIAVSLKLNGGEINVRFDIIHNASGGKSVAIIPFSKR
ncbi:hypothetical protein [Maritalea sp.]|uniref:hypothetical protein n=1 Tax=Maritalea sp. TaxID=2003361 RepID=UPI0039E270B5